MTPPPVRTKTWCFTAHDLNFNFEEQLQPLGPKYCVYQHEICPQTQKEHLQGYIQFTSHKSLKRLKKARPTDHWEPRRGTHEQAREYCMKAETRKPGTEPIEHGTFTTSGQRTDLQALAEDIRDNHLTIKEVATREPAKFVQYHRGLTALCNIHSQPYTHDQPRGIWIYGPPGVGKSHIVREHFKDLYIKPQNKWFDGYHGQHSILLDDLDKSGTCLAHYLKIWTDKYAFSAEVKGGTVNMQHRHFIVTSNYSIDELFPPHEDPQLNEAITRRFKIHKFVTRQFPPQL